MNHAKSLAEHFAPTFYFHENESFFPTNIHDILQFSDLVEGNQLIQHKPKMKDVIHSQTIVKDPTKLRLKLSDVTARNGSHNFSNIKVYCLKRDGVPDDYRGIDLVYIVPFAHHTAGLYTHDYGFTHVTVRLGIRFGNVVTERLGQDLNVNQYEVDSVFYGGYGRKEGIWRINDNTKDSVQFVDQAKCHPMVFVAKGSHACYSSKGIYPKDGGSIIDLCHDKGKQWSLKGNNIEMIQMINKSKTKEIKPIWNIDWLNFVGLWDRFHFDSRLLISETNYTQNGVSRFLFSFGFKSVFNKIE